jgi:hypothetical protein
LFLVWDVLSWLVRDDPERARQAVTEGGRHWEQSSTGFQLQRMFQLVAESLADIHAGGGRTAWSRIQQQWSAIRRSLVFRIHHPRFHMLWLHAASALTAGSDKALLQEAERDARGLDHLNTIASNPISCAIRAAIAAKRGQEEVSLRLLATATAGFEAAGMALHAAAMRRRRGKIVGGEEGRVLVQAAEAFMQRQKIVNPERMTAILAPGFRDD